MATRVAVVDPGGQRKRQEYDDEYDDFDDDLVLDAEAERKLQQIEAEYETQQATQRQRFNSAQQQQQQQHPVGSISQPLSLASTPHTSQHQHQQQSSKRPRSPSSDTFAHTLKHARTANINGDHPPTSTALTVEHGDDHARIEALMRDLAKKDAELLASKRALQSKEGEVKILRAQYHQEVATYSTLLREKEDALAANRTTAQQIRQTNDELQAENKTLKSFRTFEVGTSAAAVGPLWSSVTASVARRRGAAAAAAGAGAGQVSMALRDYSQSNSQTAAGLNTPTRRNRNGAAPRNLGSPANGDGSPSSRSRSGGPANTPRHLQRSSQPTATHSGGSRSETQPRKAAAFPGFVNSFTRPVLAKETQPQPPKGATRARSPQAPMADDEVFRDDATDMQPTSSSAPRDKGDALQPSSQSEVRVSGEVADAWQAVPSGPGTPTRIATPIDRQEADRQKREADARMQYLWAVKTYSAQQGKLASLVLAHTSDPCYTDVSSTSTLQRLLRPSLPTDCAEPLRQEYDAAVHHFLNTLSTGAAVDAEERFAYLREPMPANSEEDKEETMADCVRLMDDGVAAVLEETVTSLRIMMAISFKTKTYAHVYDVLMLLRSITTDFLTAIQAIIKEIHVDVPTVEDAEPEPSIVIDVDMLDSEGMEEQVMPRSAAASLELRHARRLELNVEQILIGAVQHLIEHKVDAAAPVWNARLLHAVVSMLDVLVSQTRQKDQMAFQCVHKVKAVLAEPGCLIAMLDSVLAGGSIDRALAVLTKVCHHDSLWRIALSAPRGVHGAGKPHRTLIASSSDTALFEVLAKVMVDGRVVMDEEAYHATHCAVIEFVSQLAVCHPDEAAPLIARSGPVLAALVKCLQVDTDALWIEGALCLPDTPPPAANDDDDDDDDDVVFMPSPEPLLDPMLKALHRVCLDVRLMSFLYRDDETDQAAGGGGGGGGGKAAPLAQTLTAPHSQLLLNGIRQYFVVALSRVAYQPEPTWMEPATIRAATTDGLAKAQAVEEARTALGEYSDVAAELLELVLTPDEIEACWEALADEEEEEGMDRGEGGRRPA